MVGRWWFLGAFSAVAMAALGCDDGGAGGTDDGSGGVDAAPTSVCLPTAGGPYWLVEGEAVSFVVACSTGHVVEGDDAFTVTPLPAGATWDGAARRFSWTPGLDQAAVLELTVTATALGESGAVKLGVADAFDTPGNVPVVDPLAYPEELGLPVFFLEPGPLDPEVYTPTTIVYRGKRYAGTEGKKRGATSLSYPKNSYTLKFDRDDGFDEPTLGGGLVDRHKIVLTTTFDDNAYVRQRLAYELWNRMSPDHLDVRVFSAVVYLDGRYQGLYLVSDHIDDDFMAARGHAKTGNLYKALNHDANFRTTDAGGAAKGTLHQGYEKKEGLPAEGEPGAFDDLDALVAWVAASDATSFRAQVDQRLVRADFEDWWIFVTFILADDSAGKNCYLYHDPAGGLGGWRYAPWDFNHSFGQTWETERESYADDVEYRGRNLIFTRLLDDPGYAAGLAQRYHDLLRGVWDKAAILALVDAWIAEIDASARRDWRKWEAAYRAYEGFSWRTDFTSYDQEVEYLRGWIADRWDYQAARY